MEVRGLMSPSQIERRLSAIMAADVVGYSGLIEADEVGTLTVMRELRDTIWNPHLAEHRGRIVKLMGDGLIAEFGSVVDAVACAAALQRQTAAHQAETASEPPHCVSDRHQPWRCRGRRG